MFSWFARFFTTKNKFSILISLLSLSVGLSLIGGLLWFISPKRVEDISATDDVARLDLTRIEIADTLEERAQGLMFRESLCETCAMLFVFPNEAQRNFWMKDTSISLDIIFMNADGVINTIHESTTPFTLATYDSAEPSQYVLEVNAEYSRRFDLQVGDRLPVDAFLEAGIEFGKAE
jgi:uncharacterized membrane protein (UPF0127 family)